jgi:hypothetical protein
LAAGTWLVGLILMAGLACLAGHQSDVFTRLMPMSFGFTHAVMLLLVTPLFSWTFTALMATLVATGRPWLWAGVLGGAFGTGIALALAQEYLSPAVFEIILSGWLLLSGSLYLAGAAWAFSTALRKRHLTNGTVLAAVAFWLVVSAIVVFALPGPPRSSIAWQLQSVGCLALAILPFAAMPLAIAWNRHR